MSIILVWNVVLIGDDFMQINALMPGVADCATRATVYPTFLSSTSRYALQSGDALADYKFER